MGILLGSTELKMKLTGGILDPTELNVCPGAVKSQINNHNIRLISPGVYQNLTL